MIMFKKGISSCNLLILVIVFCMTVHWKVVSANEEDITQTNTPNLTTNLPTEKIHQDTPETKVPNILSPSEEQPTETEQHIPLLISPDSIEESTSTNSLTETPSVAYVLQTLPFTQTSSFVFHDTDTSPASSSGVDSDSLLVGAVTPIIQKCCKPHQVLHLGQYNSECVDVDTHEDFVIDVFWANRTHYWNYTKSTARNVSVVTRNPCTQSKYILDPLQDVNDTFHLLHNSSLYVPYTMDMYTVDDYCVDIIKTSATTLLTTAVICTSTPKTDVFHYLFGTGLLISVICLIMLAVYSMWRTDIDDDHKKCLAFFSGTMSMSFLLIAISTFFGKRFHCLLNILIAYLVYYLKLKYFIWLTVLCYDTYRCVKLATDDKIDRNSFIKRYMLAAFLIPAVFILINLFDRYNPALPNLYLEFSYSSSFLWALLLFYGPTIITGCINIYIMYSIMLPKGKCKDFNEFLNYMRSENWKPTPAPENISQLKNMYRRTVILCFLVLLFLILDLLIFLMPSSGQQQAQFMFRNVVYCLQGLFVSCIFIRKDCCQKPRNNILNTTDTEMKLLRNGENV